MTGPSKGRSNRALLFMLALVFSCAAIVQAVTWMYYVRWTGPQVPVELGYDSDYDAALHGELVKSVSPSSPAEAAGLKANDLIVAANGQELTTSDAPRIQVWVAGHPGEAVDLTIRRPGEAQPLTIRGYFRARTQISIGTIRAGLGEITSSFPVLFLVVGLPVLFLRLDDRNAWLLALLFSAFAAAPDFPGSFSEAPHALRVFSFAFRALLVSFLGPLFFWFFSVFPVRSPLDQRFPRLKWAWLALGVIFMVPGLSQGGPRTPHILVHLMGESSSHALRLAYVYGGLFLGLLSLVANGLSEMVEEKRRKLRVLLWGTVVGLGPSLTVRAIADFARWEKPPWLDAATVILMLLFPLSFGYAVVKHRVLDVPVLLKRSARYVLVRRGFAFLVVLLAVCADVLFTIAFPRISPVGPKLATAAGVGFGIVLAWVSAPALRQVTERIDRSFFRGAYDVRLILMELAEHARSATSREQLAELLEQQVTRALHPSSITIYLRTGPEFLESQSALRAGEQPKLRADLPELLDLAQHGVPREAPPESEESDAGSLWALFRAECLVPIRGRGEQLLGLVVLGPRKSEEAYSSEDKALLRSVAGQAGIALENIALAEQMAERLDAERRAAQEMQIAREVQRKLLPQQAPPLATLDYAGECLQARAVGGDYYDFLDLGPGRVGFVLADVAGKGISAALLMANLQANLRSQYATALEDPRRLLRGVNQLFYSNTEDNRYATLFFGCYDDAQRRLQYINCGHNPPVLLRRDGSLERLHATATVLGMFSEWNCDLAEVQLSSGDVLVIFTDGVTEACDRDGVEFGETRLIDAMSVGRALPAAELLHRIQAAVQSYSPSEQQDDLTLLVARCRQA
jgi:sigma-B regulation protein RsbU (phosphoserine phosphatase)